MVLVGLSGLFIDLLHFNGSCVDFVVLRVSTDELDEDNSGLVRHGHNKTVLVPLMLNTIRLFPRYSRADSFLYPAVPSIGRRCLLIPRL